MAGAPVAPLGNRAAAAHGVTLGKSLRSRDRRGGAAGGLARGYCRADRRRADMREHAVYRLYGLAIESAIALPLPLAGRQNGADLQLVYPGRSMDRLSAVERGGRDLAIDDRGWQLSYRTMTGDWVCLRYCRADQ